MTNTSLHGYAVLINHYDFFIKTQVCFHMPPKSTMFIGVICEELKVICDFTNHTCLRASSWLTRQTQTVTQGGFSLGTLSCLPQDV